MPKQAAINLPAWATQQEDGRIFIDPDEAYPEVLEEILPALGLEEPDQYAVACAYHFARLHVMHAIRRKPSDPAPKRTPQFRVRSHEGRKDRWSLKNFPVTPGKTPDTATKGKGAKRLYQEIYGFVPN